MDLARKVANSSVNTRTGFLNERKCKCTYGISLFHTSTPERRVTTHTVKTTRPAGPVPIYYGIYAIHPAQWRGFITVQYIEKGHTRPSIDKNPRSTDRSISRSDQIRDGGRPACGSHIAVFSSHYVSRTRTRDGIKTDRPHGIE